MNKIWRKCLLSWQIPSIGFGLTFILGLGFSYSNQNIRSEVQSVGLVVFTVLVAIGQIGGTARTPIYEGSHDLGSPKWKSTQASSAIAAAALRQEKLTIIAQGLLTNVATVIVNHPDLVKNIDRIIMVAGKRPGDLFHLGQQWWFHFRDSRFKDRLIDRLIYDPIDPN